MKQTIMEKLFSEKPLTNEEILHIGSHLTDEEETTEGGGGVMGKNVPFNHTVKDSLAKACGLENVDFDHINKLIRTEVMDRKDDLDCDSKEVEVYERIGLAKPKNFRVLMYQFVKMKSTLRKTGTGTIIGGRGGGGFGDFLDFLRRQGGQ